MMNKRFFFIVLTAIITFGFTSCKEAETVTPEISIAENISIVEGNSQTTKAVIPVTLSSATDKQVSLTYTTTDGTAKSGEDFVAITSTVLVFAPGETTQNIEVVIHGDSAYENDEVFYVTISNIRYADVTSYRSEVKITNDDAFNPEIKIAPLTKVVEGTATPVKALVSVTLTPASDKEVTLKWSTLNGTAKSGTDYTGFTNASIVFAPGEKIKNIEVPIMNDSDLEFNDSFFIVVDEITNASISAEEIKISITDDDSYSPELAADGYITPGSYEGMELIWGDEFDGTELNTSYWTHELGAGGWGNNELQTYTSNSANSFVADGKLNIVAINNGGSYSSARLVTKAKKEFVYGRIDIRAKMPYGQGIWPALWMLGGNISQVSWPKCGEIDIMEYLGHEESKIYGTVHYDNGGHQYIGGFYSLSGGQGYNDQFHVFTVLWQENSIVWYVDYNKYFEATSASIKFGAFDLPQFFIFNLAVGGNWPGPPNASTVFPQTMTVDYVRVFQPA